MVRPVPHRSPPRDFNQWARVSAVVYAVVLVGGTIGVLLALLGIGQ
jgi:hypothetical protein